MEFIQACQRFGLTPKQVMKSPLRAPFKDAYALYFMDVMHKAFWDKAEGDQDRFGIVWVALKEVTIRLKQQMVGEVPGDESQIQKYKPNGQKNGLLTYEVTAAPQISGIYTHRQYLSPKQLATYRSRASGKHRSTRNSRGLASVQHGTTLENAELINVRSGRLAAAFAPVTASRGRLYQSNPDSSYYWEDRADHPIMKIRMTVPYAEEVDLGSPGTPARQLLPPDFILEGEVNDEAVVAGLTAAKRIHDLSSIRN